MKLNPNGETLGLVKWRKNEMAVVRQDADECPICEEPVVNYGGKRNSDILVIVELPDDSDYEKGKILHGSGNKPLYDELSKQGLDLFSMRLVSLYLHAKPDTRTKVAREKWEKCQQVAMERLLAEADGKRFVLCVGSEVTKYFLGYGDVQCSGIPLKSKYLSAEMVMGIQTIAYASTKVIGEFRLAVERFAEEVHNRRKK